MEEKETMLEGFAEELEMPQEVDLFGDQAEEEGREQEGAVDEEDGDIDLEELFAEERAGSENQTVLLKYNGQEIEKPLEEVLMLAQKGMNYDHVKGKLEQAQQDAPAAALVKQLAQRQGMSPEEFARQAEWEMENKAVFELIQQGVPEGMARELTALRAERRAAEQQELMEKKQKPWLDFVMRYPEIGKKGELEPEVKERIRAGMNPVQAQMDWENQQLRQQLEAFKAKEGNRKNAPGSAAGTETADQEDAFLRGFFGG
ncbi:MAG: hypothetical protein IIV90_07595 [Oscillospiraceae bacterium]|nr:hypothetical protein [Oscillospiraceae bacterium]